MTVQRHPELHRWRQAEVHHRVGRWFASRDPAGGV